MSDPLPKVDDILESLSVLSRQGTSEAWEAAFSANPDALNKLLADYIKQIYATPGRVGQRPMPREDQVDLETLIHGDITDRPLREVLPRLIRPSERAFANRIHMSRTQLQRTLAGEYQPTITELANIAEAAGVPPAYFLEYRVGMVVAAFIKMLFDRPVIATNLYREYLTVTTPRRRRR